MMFKQSTRPPLPRGAAEDNLPPSMSPPSSDAMAPAPAVGDGGKRLIVGQGIKLKGEISACDRLIVEGRKVSPEMERFPEII